MWKRGFCAGTAALQEQTSDSILLKHKVYFVQGSTVIYLSFVKHKGHEKSQRLNRVCYQTYDSCYECAISSTEGGL